ncbi:MAG: RraA family protein [Paracoccaceae bacterium]
MGDYILNPLPPQMDPARAARLAQVEAATLGHYLHAGFADTGLRPVIPGHRIAGAAVTVQIAGPCSTLLYHAMDRVRPGDVLVIDRAGDSRHACWGGFMAAVARVRGLAGVIVDGCVTDPDAIRAEGVPTWGRDTSAITTKLLNMGGAFNVPVSIGGVAVSPGDAVLADDCGIVVVPASRLDALTHQALEEQAEEGDWVKRVEAGARLQDLIDIDAMMGLTK